MSAHWKRMTIVVGASAILNACAAGLTTDSQTGSASPAGGSVAYEKSSCCELEDPTFHHLKVMKPERVAEKFRFRIESDPSVPVAGQDTRIHVYIEEPGLSSGGLGTLPERSPNFLILSENLTEMHHFHPEDLGDWEQSALFEGRFTLPVRFRQGGNHWMIVDFLEKATIVTTSLKLEVEGPPQEPTAWDFSKVLVAEGLTATWRTSPDSPRLDGLMNAIVKLSKQTGEPVTDLERYANALAHIALVPGGDAAAARHLHGGGQEHGHFRVQEIVPNYAGPKIYFNDRIRKEGNHRALVQFRRASSLQTLAFDFTTGSRPFEGF